jgi:hypothetical protein
MKYLNLLVIPFLLMTTGAFAQSANDDAEVVDFPAEYFNRFKPLTALDMVQQVPGFQLEESDDGTRGYAGAGGNLLINDRRPSAKQDLPSAILGRIPASMVERVELVRGQVRGIDLRGQSQMINVIIRENTPATVKWEATMLVPFQHGPLTPSIYTSLSDSWRDIEYNAGFSIYKNSYGRDGIDQILDGNGQLTEERINDRENRNTLYKGNLNTVSRLDEETLIKFNTVFTYETRDQVLVSDRNPQAPGTDPREESFVEDIKTPTIEIGLDMERALTSKILGKAILLYYHSDQDALKSQTVIDDEGNQTFYRLADGNTAAQELITRLEFDWAFHADHNLQLNMERAYNSLDGTLVQTQDTGAGPVEVAVPGSNSFVKEERWDFLLQDTWSLGEMELDYGLGAETSTISQIGDAEQSRDFFFLKPQAILTWSTDQGQQTKFRVAREVAQLDLNDFVSATVFEDDDLALGNPNLKPDTTWVTELSHERRFGGLTVVKARVFHHWISDVLDLLPLTDTFETPGNIGDGRRWGIEVESSFPMDWIGLKGSKFDIKARLQDSTVNDPVTGISRRLSSPGGDFPIIYNVQNKYAVEMDFRQDFEAQRVAWGWDVVTRAERPLYKVNELEIYDDKYVLNLFVETTRWLGVKVRLSGSNVLDSPGYRDRTVFTGRRDLSPVRFREVRDLARDRSVTLSVSGVF